MTVRRRSACSPNSLTCGGNTAVTTCTRARVAITAALRVQPYDCCENIHVGHARALLLGSLIAQELGIPYHVRYDGPTGDASDCVLDVVNCLNFLHIPYDRMYWQPQVLPTHAMLVAKLGPAVADSLWNVLSAPELGAESYRCQMLDDVGDYAPSLIVRGREVREPHEYFGPALEPNAEHARRENILFNAAGAEKHEINTPMLMLGHRKMSKTAMCLVHWTALTAASWQDARNFLIATALCPGKPTDALGDAFKISLMSEEPYAWSWHDWAKMAGLQ